MEHLSYEQLKAFKEANLKFNIISPIPNAYFPLRLFSSKYKDMKNMPFIWNYENLNAYYPKYPALPRGIAYKHRAKIIFNKIKGLAEKTISFGKV